MYSATPSRSNEGTTFSRGGSSSTPTDRWNRLASHSATFEKRKDIYITNLDEHNIKISIFQPINTPTH